MRRGAVQGQAGEDAPRGGRDGDHAGGGARREAGGGRREGPDRQVGHRAGGAPARSVRGAAGEGDRVHPFPRAAHGGRAHHRAGRDVDQRQAAARRPQVGVGRRVGDDRVAAPGRRQQGPPRRRPEGQRPRGPGLPGPGHEGHLPGVGVRLGEHQQAAARAGRHLVG